MSRLYGKDGENLPRYIVHYIAIVVSITAFVSAYAAYNSSENLKSSLIEACEDNRTPLARYFEDEITNMQGISPDLFPDIPPDQFRGLIRNNVSNLREVTEQFDPARCDDQYR